MFRRRGRQIPAPPPLAGLLSKIRPKGLTSRQKNQVKALVRGEQEMKYGWTTGVPSFGATGAATPPVFSQLTQIAQGDT